jgi:hypothetical protein
MNPKGPELKAVARAGALVKVQWSGIIRTHYGPGMQYMAYLGDKRDVNPTTLDWFKIHERGYDAQQKLWANEVLIKNNRTESFRIPSDIKPGMYVLRTELLSLHYATKTGPQFYSHCFNVDVQGSGTASPPGVKIPGAYKAKDPGLNFPLYNGNAQNGWERYVVPGPPKYAGKYEAPTGSPPVVADKDRGIFPAAFQKKYDALKAKEDAEGLAFNDKLNAVQQALGHSKVTPENEGKLMPVFREHMTAQQQLDKEMGELRKEAIKLGIAA